MVKPTLNSGMTYGLFKYVQRIGTIVDKEANECVDCEEKIIKPETKDFPDLYTLSTRSKNGLFFLHDGTLPYLITPWGIVNLVSPYRGGYLGHMALIQLFSKRFDAHHVKRYTPHQAMYAIRAVEGKCLPVPELLLKAQYDDYDAVNRNWVTMMARYKAEIKSA